jgi:glycosyltransferase involved in cell wall biosynthesis
MKTPRSVYIAFEAFPRPKGASTHMASMLQALCNGYGPVLLLCLGFGDMPSFQEEGDILICRCKAYHPNMLKRSEAFGRFVAGALERWGKDVSLCVFRDPWGGMPAVLSGHRCLFEVNALPSWELGYTYPAFQRNPALKHKIMDMETCCLEGSSRVLTVSAVTARALMGRGVSEDKITTICNCAAAPFFGSPEPARPCGDIPPGRWIGYVGSLHPWQGVEEAVSAFSLVAERFPAVNLLLVTGGQKEQKKRIRKRVRKLGLEQRVSIRRPMPHEALSQALRQCEFTLAPLLDTPRNTRQGCCPVKIIESMAAGVPVLATNLAPVRDLIHHGRDGWLVDPGPVRHLALGMDRLLGDRALTRALAQSAARRAIRDFHPHRVHRALCHCFAKTLTSKGVRYGHTGPAAPGQTAAGIPGRDPKQTPHRQEEAPPVARFPEGSLGLR